MVVSMICLVSVMVFSSKARAQTTTGPEVTTTPSLEPTSNLPSFEIDVVFPRPNVTYNATDYIPIVFAFHNLSAATVLGSFTFSWSVMPYGVLPNISPGGVHNDKWETRVTAENVHELQTDNGSPYLLVNATNRTTAWDYSLRYNEQNVQALQWRLKWDKNDSSCESPYIFESKHLFYLTPTLFDAVGPNPGDLTNITENCATFGSMHEIDVRNGNPCSSIRNLDDTTGGEACMVKLDSAQVSSISSKALALAKPTETSTASTAPVSTNVAAATPVFIDPLVAAGVIGGLQFLPLY